MHFYGNLGRATMFLLISAILNLMVFLIGGFPIVMLVGFVLYALMALGLMRNMRWLAYLAFIMLLFGVIGAYAAANFGSLSGLLLWGIVFADLAAIVFLFIYLWKDKSQTA